MEDYDGDMSKFNEGMFKMMRIHELQSRINAAKQNPRNFNFEFGCYNFLLIYRLCNQYLQEIISKLKDNERTKIKGFRNDLRKFIEKYPVIKLKKDKQELDERRLKIFLINLEEFETDLRDLADIHNMGSPSDDDSGL